MQDDHDPENQGRLYDFDVFVRYYELDHEGFEEDVPLYMSLAQRLGDPILELGCGTGRLLLPLAEAGYAVVGVDLASRMLAVARDKVERAGVSERVELVEADIRDFNLDTRFRFAFLGLNTLLHVPSLAGQLAVLQTAFRHLRSGGLLAVDLPNPHACNFTDEQTPLLLEKEMRDPQTGNRILKLFSQRGDHASQISDITLIYDEIDAGGAVHRTLAPIQMRYLYPYEARLLMEVAGFRVDGIYGDYALEAFESESERMILLGRVP